MFRQQHIDMLSIRLGLSKEQDVPIYRTNFQVEIGTVGSRGLDPGKVHR